MAGTYFMHVFSVTLFLNLFYVFIHINHFLIMIVCINDYMFVQLYDGPIQHLQPTASRSTQNHAWKAIAHYFTAAGRRWYVT